MLDYNNASRAEIIICSVVIFYLILSRLFPYLISKLIQYKYNCSLKIGRIGLPYLAFHNVVLKKNEFTIHFDRIGFTSSLFQNDAPKLLSVKIASISVILVKGSKNNFSASQLNSQINSANNKRKKYKSPLFISNLVQFLGVHIKQIFFWTWDKLDDKKGVHFNAQIQNILIDGCTTVGMNLSACILLNLEKIEARISENWLPREEDLIAPMESSYFNGKSGLTLLDWNLDFKLNLMFRPKNSGEFIEHLNIDVEKLSIFWRLKEKSLSLFKMWQKQQMQQSIRPTLIINDSPENSLYNTTLKVENIILSQAIPKEIKFRIFETECRISDTDSENPFESFVDGFSFTSRCNVLNNNDQERIIFESQLNLGLIRIEPDTHQCFFVDQLSNYIKIDNRELTIDLDFTNLFLKSLLKGIQFTKAKLNSKSMLRPIPKENVTNPAKLISSFHLTLESNDLDAQISENSCSFKSLFVEAQCKDLNNIWIKDNSSLEVIIKNLNTSIENPEDKHSVYKPLSLELFGFHLKREVVGAKLSGSRIHWIPLLEEYLDYLEDLIPLNPRNIESRDESNIKKPIKKDKKSSLKLIKGFNIEVFDSKFVYMSKDKLSLNADLGTLSTNSDNNIRNINIERFEVFSSSIYSDCTLNPLFTIPKCAINTSKKDKEKRYNVDFYSNTVIYWSPLLHLQIIHFRDKIISIKNKFIPPKQLENLKKEEKKDESKEKSASASKLVFAFRFKKKLSLIGKLAKNHSFEFVAFDWNFEKGPDHFESSCKILKLRFDGVKIGRFDDFILMKGPPYKTLTKSHRKMADLSQKENISWSVGMSKLSLTFPFGYNFAEAFTEEFLTCFKWLKQVHSGVKSRKSSSGDSITSDSSSDGSIYEKIEEEKLSSDISIKIKNVRIEIGDDPFEVKLRDNYELLEDEYFENLKRFQVLETKINQLYKTNLLMSSSKVDELRSQLREKTSTIYIQRSKQMHKNHSMRTHLLLWELENIQIVALADPSMFGKEKVKNILKELNSESPWPSDDIEFVTLWCRAVYLDVANWRVQLRDFPQPLMDSKNIHFWGKLAGAEAKATKRSLRSCEIEIGGPFDTQHITRSLNGIKWYYDLNCEVDCLSLAFGPCWEPVLAQCNLSFENIFPPSRDPSKPLPFWDKIRLIFHGRLYMSVKTLTHLLHASLNPYNTTEEMEVTWSNGAIAWTNGKIIFEGELNILVRTASKYDDCKMIHLPSVRLTFKLNWVCLADSNDHHAVIPCAPDKVPEYSSNQEHDSYRAFRSQNLNMSLNLETRGGSKSNSTTSNAEVLLSLYGSTLRWFENLKLILSGTTRPTRRGVIFCTGSKKELRPKKIPISRHYKKVRLSISLNRFHVCYWVSFSKQSGIEVFSGKFSSSSEHMLTLQPINDGLIHRPRADWNVSYMNSELNDSEIWLQASLQQDIAPEMNYRRPIEKFFFMSIDKLSYGREAFPLDNVNTPQHRLVVHELKGAWTSSNRDVAFALFDSFVKVQQLKKNLSTKALKSFFSKHEATTTGSPVHKSSSDNKIRNANEISSPTTSSGNAIGAPQNASRSTVVASPLSSIQQGQNAAASLLQKLISEADSRGVVFSEDLTSPPPQQSLHGLSQSSLDDVILQKWQIELVNCQVLLKGCETSGYAIVSATKAHILQREHKPVWKHGTLVPKTTWVGAFEGMQYYATVGNTEAQDENIQWLSLENIEERDSYAISTIPDMVGSGQSVGGVVSETVGASSDEAETTVQLQRIVSKCKCEFFYTTYGETGVDKVPTGIPDIPPPPSDLELLDETSKPVEAFTLMHHDLNIFTNSLQYAMILDIVNNLVLYVDPKRKESFEKLQRLRFKLQLQSYEAQRGPIQHLQNHLRNLVNQQRRMEKETYNVQRLLLEDPQNETIQSQRNSLEQQVNECKEQVAAKGEELHMMIMCYKEAKLASQQRLSRKRDNKDIYLVRVYEICFKHAQWRLTQTDGQLGIADLVLSNFLYTKTAKSDDSVEHLCELGYITVTNLLPNQQYKDVLVPTHIHASMPVDRQRTLRVFCRDRPPVGGIAVKEHFEINIAPITIGMTYQFFKTLFKFCFPEKDPEKLDEVELTTGGNESDTASLSSVGGASISFESQTSSVGTSVSLPVKGKKTRVKRKESKFYVSMNEKDDVEKMKERAEKNMLFICVKIPEVPVRVSYKGEKEKNIEDVHDVQLLIPTVEYNNITWTWLDLLVAVRNHSKRVLLSQAIKQKLLWSKSIAIFSDGNAPQEEDKAKMLLGNPGESKGLKKSLFKK